MLSYWYNRQSDTGIWELEVGSSKPARVKSSFLNTPNQFIFLIFAKQLFMKKIVLLSFCAFTLLAAQAQDEAAMMKKWQDYATPADMQALLAKSEGNWDADISVWMGPGGEPMKNKATSEVKMIMGGRYQVANNKGSFGGMPYEGMSIIGYDNAKKIFQSSWVDNMGTGVMTMEGTYDPATKTLILTGKGYDPMAGKDMNMKQTFRFTDDKHQVIEMYQITDGKEFKAMEMKLTKK